MKQIVLISCLLLAGSACKKADPRVEADLGYRYYPVDSGNTWIYQVDSIAYDDNTQSVDTFHFFMMCRIGGIVADQNFKDHQVMERFVRKNDTSDWLPRTNSYILKTSNNLQLVEENARVVKLVFPIGNVMSWNGNMYNNLGRRTFYLLSQNVPFNNGFGNYSNTVKVQEEETNNAIEEILVESIYAKDTGLISFTNTNINTQVTGSSGYRVFQNLISFTKP